MPASNISPAEFLGSPIVCPLANSFIAMGYDIACEDAPPQTHPLALAEQLCPNVLLNEIQRLDGDTRARERKELAWHFIELGLLAKSDAVGQACFEQAPNITQLIISDSSPRTYTAMQASIIQSNIPIFKARRSERQPSPATMHTAYRAVGNAIGQLLPIIEPLGEKHADVSAVFIGLLGELGIAGLLAQHASLTELNSCMPNFASDRENSGVRYPRFAHDYYLLDDSKKTPLQIKFKFDNRDDPYHPAIKRLYFANICRQIAEEWYRPHERPSIHAIALKIMQNLCRDSQGQSIPRAQQSLLDFSSRLVRQQIGAL